MSVLSLHVGRAGVTALVVAADGEVAGRGHHDLATTVPGPGLAEQSPDEIWRATLAAGKAALAAYAGTGGPAVRALGIANQSDTLLLWDQETLGAPRPAMAPEDRRAAEVCATLREAGHEERVREVTGLRLDPALTGPRLRWLAENEPNTWALVREGRYAVGTVESYLVTRMSRGTWHVTDVANASRSLLLDLGTGRWSGEMCDLFGVPVEALPDVVPSWGGRATTDPRMFLGLELPVSGLAVDRAAALFGRAGFDVGATCCTTDPDPGVLTLTGPQAVRGDVLAPTAAWRSPEGVISHALGGPEPDVLPSTVPVTRVTVLEQPAVAEAAALGAAYLAGLGVGLWGSFDELRTLIA